MLTKPDWAFINSFAGWASAFGTLLAVVVSLYLAVRDWRVRFRVNVGLRRIFRTGDQATEEADFIVISVTNVGRRSAAVTGLFWHNRLVLHRYGYQLPGDPPLSAQIPVKLMDGDEADFVIALKGFMATNDPSEFGRLFLPKPRLLTGRFLRMQIRTSTRTFTAPIEEELRRQLIQWVQSAMSASNV